MTRIEIRNILYIIWLNIEPVCILIVHVLSGYLLVFEVELASFISTISPF